MAMGTILVPGLGALLLFAVPLDVTLLAAPIASPDVLGVVSSGLLLVAPLLLGVNTSIGVISGVERHLMMVSVLASIVSSGSPSTIIIIHRSPKLLDSWLSWRTLCLG